MDPQERKRWKELVANAPVGLLKRRDRLVVEQLVKLWTEMRRGKLSMTGHRLLASLTAKLGLNPSDASRTAVPIVKPKSAKDAIANRIFGRIDGDKARGGRP